MKIAIFDSGIGGVTVLKEFTRTLTDQEYLYFGDTANVPYGSKSPTQIKELVTSAAKRIAKFKPDLLIVACNTAASIALKEFKKTLKIPVLSVVDAGIHSIEKEIDRAPQKPVLVLGTNTTIRSKTYSKLLKKSHPKTKVIEQACPLLVPMIEEGWTHHPVLEMTLKEYLNPHLSKGPGTALLGCTHYPWVQKVVQKQLPGWVVLNSATSALQLVCNEFEFKPKKNLTTKPKIKWYFSDPDSVPVSLLGIEHKVLQKF